MYTDSQEYYALLHRIQQNNPPEIALLLPSYESFYEIDLNKRTITSPEYLSIKEDHKAETVYFKVARYYGHTDLANMCCVVQYINASGEGRVYAVPFYDIETLSDTDEILFPWVIDGEATKTAGEVQYSVRFFKLDNSGTYLLYNLSTLPATGLVKQGIKMQYEEVYNEIELDITTYQKGKYYVLNKSGNYELATESFDEQQTYYERSSLTGTMTDYTATFLDQMVSYAHECSERDLYWIVL